METDDLHVAGGKLPGEKLHCQRGRVLRQAVTRGLLVHLEVVDTESRHVQQGLIKTNNWQQLVSVYAVPKLMR